MDMASLQSLNLVLVLGMFAACLPGTNAKVLEMDDRLIELTTQGKWLVVFYAPWCGHCRKLEPIMDDVAASLKDKSSLTIAKVDATRFNKAASHFEIKAYPTIKFINGGKLIDYHGERRKSHIMEFITKAESPKITKITSQADFEQRKTRYRHFFLLVTPSKEDDSHLKKEFYELANMFYLDAFFFHATMEHVNRTLGPVLELEWPFVIVMKENEYFQHDANTESLIQFVRNERFLTFTEITMSNFHNLIETRKMLAIVNVNSIDKHREKQTTKLMRNFEKFSKENRHINHNDFLFGYVDNSDLLSGIAIWTLQTPLLFVLNTSSNTYSMFDVIDVERKELLDVDFQEMLDKVRSGTVEVYGGHGYFRKLRRPFWELYRAIVEMFYEAPFLSLLIFGFPFAVISIVFYFLCCVDSNDQTDEENMNSDSGSEVNEEDYYLDEREEEMNDQIEDAFAKKDQ